jgi:hypothetical protein
MDPVGTFHRSWDGWRWKAASEDAQCGSQGDSSHVTNRLFENGPLPGSLSMEVLAASTEPICQLLRRLD